MGKTRFDNKIYICLACLIVMLLNLVFAIGAPALAYADVTTTSSVLSDLSQDENFNVSKYPMNNNDYSIKVIQVAESVDGYLVIYTYQPSNVKEPLDVTKVNMSLSQEVDRDRKSVV